MSSKSNIVSEKDFYKIKAGTTLFSPRIDQFGEITIKEYFFEGKRCKSELESFLMYDSDKVLFSFKKENKNLVSVPSVYPDNSPLFWTRRSAINFVSEVKNGTRISVMVQWVKRVCKQTEEYE